MSRCKTMAVSKGGGHPASNRGVVVAAPPEPGRAGVAEVVKVERTVLAGMPDVRRITTSHIESQNLTLRMHCRRLTRLTNAFSKKFENFQAAVALNFAYSLGLKEEVERAYRLGPIRT